MSIHLVGQNRNISSSQTLKDINLNLGTEIILAAAICRRACLASSLYDIATMQRRAAVEEQSRII